MLKFLLPLIVVSFLFSLISCGKKEKSPEEQVIIDPVVPEPEREEFLSRQEIVCEPGTYCPDYIAKIVVFDKGTPRFCTGTLVSRTRILTSASCLPSYLRSTEANCSDDVHIFFNRGIRQPDRRVCKSILQVSTLEGNNTEYWRDDVAILELSEIVYGREFRDVSRKGMKETDKLHFFGVEQLNETTGIIRKEECEVVHNSYLYPLSLNESSPNVLLSGCKRKAGYRGASIMDSIRIRGVLSDNSPLRAGLENSSLLIKPLKDFIHVTNFACAPFLNYTSVLNEQECAKRMDYTTLAAERSRLLSDEERFSSIVLKFEKAADSKTKYYRVVASLLQEKDSFILSYMPVCFKNVSSWIKSVQKDGDVYEQPDFPSRILKKGLDSNGRAVTQEFEGTKINYGLTFSGKRLYKEKLSDVFLRVGDSPSRRLEDIRACQ